MTSTIIELKRNHEPCTPSLSAWIVSFISIFVISGCILSGLRYGEFLRTANEISDLETLIYTAGKKDIIHKIKLVLVPQGLSRWVHFRQSTVNETLSNRLDSLLNIQTLMDNNQFVESYDALQLVGSKLRAFGDAAFAEGLLAGGEHITQAKGLYQLQHSLNTEMNKLEEETAALEREYDSLSREVHFFFSIPLQAESKKFQYYKEGVLKGLPLVTGISDGLSDLQALAKRISASGGSIRIENDRNPHEYFLERMEEFKDFAFSLQMQEQSSAEKINELKVTMDANEKKLARLKSKVAAIINNFALQIATTQHAKSFNSFSLI